MLRSIVLHAEERNVLLDTYRRHPNPALRLRAHIILLLADGYTWSALAAVLFTSSSTIDRWQRRFQQGRVPALLGQPSGRRPWFPLAWVSVVCGWVTQRSPRDFGFLRSRWTCEVVVILVLELHDLVVSRETVRRWLHRAELVWRRPRPVVRPRDPQRQAKLRALRRLLAHLPDDEIAVFQDEVDINTNPKIGCMWMRRGQQATVATPGTNEKRYLAGSINWRTGTVLTTLGKRRQGRNAELFCQHLDDLRRHYRCYRVIHVICDNARAHDCHRVQEHLEQWGDRVKIHYLPSYAPETNPIERVWWHLHEEVTRNHRCQTMQELLDFTFAWLENRNPFAIEGSVYKKPKVA